MEGTALTESAAAEEIREFRIEVPAAELEDLRGRIQATRWPDREVDPSQGEQLETIQALADYWATDYDWRALEERYAALPRFVTEIDGVDIHFIHARSEHEDALPMIVTHGWPGSTVEQLKIIDPLTKPYPNLVHYNRIEEGGHFAAWEQPEVFSEEMRAAFRSVR